MRHVRADEEGRVLMLPVAEFEEMTKVVTLLKPRVTGEMMVAVILLMSMSMTMYRWKGWRCIVILLSCLVLLKMITDWGKPGFEGYSA